MEVNFSVNIEEYEVLKSGVVISHSDKEIIFHLDDLTIKISYIEDQTNNESSINANVPDSEHKCLVLELINYDSGLGRGILEPVEIGTIQDKTLYLQFVSSTLGNKKTRIFTYTWLTKPTGGNKNE